jgi:flagellar hook-associated protein FlgK
MQGVTNFAEDWTYGKQAYNNDTDDKFWKKYFQRYAASFVPTGVEQVGKFFDDDFKKITKEFDSILLKNIVENQKAIDYDILGQPIYKIGFFNRIRKNTTTGEIKRVNPTLPKLNKYFNFNDEAGVTRLFPQQVEMTEEEESAFKLVAGRLTNDGGFPAPNGSVLRSAFKFDVVPGLEQMFKEDYYQKMPREVQEKLISATISAARGFTKNEMQKDKTISERVMTEGYDLLRKDLPNIRGMNDN